MFTLRAKDLEDAYKKYNAYLFFQDAFEYTRGATAHSFQDTILIESLDCNLDLFKVNYSISKWKQLIRLYLNLDELGMMVYRLKHYLSKGGKYLPYITMQFKSRDNPSGACLLNLSLGYHSGKWHAVVNSRANEVTVRWYADLIFIRRLLDEICEATGIDINNVDLRWNMTSSYQSITGTPLMMTYIGKEQWLIDNMENEDLTKWQASTVKRYLRTYIEKDYQNFKSQERNVKAYEVLKGERPQREDSGTHLLWLPEYKAQYAFDRLTEEEIELCGGDE